MALSFALHCEEAGEAVGRHCGILQGAFQASFSSLLYASGESFAHGNRLVLYREQFMHLVSTVNVALLELPVRLSLLFAELDAGTVENDRHGS